MFLPIFSMAFGLFILVFGFRIAILRHFHLISGYTPEKGERYARRVGLIEMGGGVLAIALGAVGIFLKNDIFSFFSLFAAIALLLFAMHLNDRTAGRSK